MPSTQVPMATVHDPSELPQNVVTKSQVSAMNDVHGQAVSDPPTQIITVGARIIRR